jgi:hypothetical protein
MSLCTHVEFETDAFPSYPGEDEEINPGMWGKRLAEYLCSELPAYGITPTQPCAEDWGWMIPIQNQAFRMFIGCGNQQETDTNRFLCFIEPSRKYVPKWLFSKVDAQPDINRVAHALNQILTSHPDIHNLRWWDENER